MKKLLSYLIALFLIVLACSDDNDEPQITLKYNLTTEVTPDGGGTISPASGSYNEGQKVTLTAKPSDGFTFKNWSGAANGSELTTTVTMSSHKKVIAVFEKISEEANTYVMSNDDWIKYFQSYDDIENELFFDKAILDEYDLVVGDYIVNTLDGGLLAKIKEVITPNNSDNIRIVLASDPSITEAFEELHEELSSEISIDLNDPGFWVDEGITVTESASKGEDLEKVITVGMEYIFYDSDGNKSTDGDQIRFDGSYTLSAGMDIDFDISKHELEKLEIGIPMNQSVNFLGQIGAVSTMESEKLLTTIPCADIVVGPVTIQPVIEIKGGVKLDLSSSLKMEYNYKKNSYTEMLYNGSDWTTTKSLLEENGFSDPEISAGIKTKLYIKPEIKFKIYRTLSPYVDVELAGKADVNINQDNLYWKLYAGFGLGAGVKMEIWKKSLFDFYFKAYEKEVLIKEGQFLSEQKTYVPDDNFEKALINLGLDDILDDYVLTSKINNIKILEIPNLNISDLTGIEDFVSLEDLWCSDNNITSVDVSNLKNLKQLTISRNRLTSLDVSKNAELLGLSVHVNELTSINVNNNTKLWVLECDGNPISSLDVTNNLELRTLFCGSQALQGELDLSNNSKIIEFDCADSNITSLDLKNGNNKNMEYFGSKNNPNLFCIQVDDAAWSNQNWSTLKDSQAKFSEDCSNSNGNGTTGLIAYYPFNGNAQDESGNGNHGTINGATLTADRKGNSNSAFLFEDSGNQRISLNNQIDMVARENFSVAAWIRLDATLTNSGDGEHQSIIGQGRGTSFSSNYPFWLTVSSSGRISYKRNSPGVQSDAFFYPDDKQWHFVVITTEGNQGKIYFDGELLASGKTGNASSSSYQISIGNLGETTGTYGNTFNGAIDDVRIYDRILSPDEINSLFSE
ncbi:LamG-like jellyroll fold domain-containing protein [Lutimonas zeaxanthinifaciens]|uniref:LamG-like jellyroll fold domain-containing protein n=1 Tax=Lutimonas zeaxanthinifaciens TaxID=3060215 RepID=UPI00265CEC57|nr:LamG-like jellyroll fold domain-containing protein [Lutimonas sp. YSD2104]WKK66348.1 leucine-rich repeat domain-containing protein [Lutimonas sp. YSD2104]